MTPAIMLIRIVSALRIQTQTRLLRLKLAQVLDVGPEGCGASSLSLGCPCASRREAINDIHRVNAGGRRACRGEETNCPGKYNGDE